MEAITSVIILILMKTLNIKAAALSTKFFYHRISEDNFPMKSLDICSLHCRVFELKPS